MDIINPLPPAIVTAVTGEPLRVIVVPIGAWNMDTTLDITVNPLVTPASIRSIQVLITDDNQESFYDLVHGKATGVDNGVQGMYAVDFVNNWIFLRRRGGGFFDSVTYDSVAISRGNILIWYVM